MSDWADESASDAQRAQRVTLDEAGIVFDDGDLVIRSSWRQVFGVAVSGGAAYLLMPRRPPAPPWVVVRRQNLPDEVSEVDAFAEHVRLRIGRTSYRGGGPQRPLLPPAELLERVLRRQEVPGALEIPVGAGPSGWWRRGVDVLTSGTAGALAGMYAGTFLSGGILPLVVAGCGIAGAITPVFVADSWRTLRKNASSPRVMVLAPDGCVVGLPSGPAAFAWSDVGAFSNAKSEATNRQELSVVSGEGEPIGSIDAAWFGEPLDLIVAVAEAYRRRVTA